MKHKRLWLGVLLLVLLALLMIYSSLEYDRKDPKIVKYALENFNEYNNTEISFVAEILEINETSLTLKVRIEEAPYPLMKIKTNNIDNNLQEGAIIEVLGILDGEDHVTAKKIWTHEQWKDVLIYLRSIPAIPFALYLFFRTWRFNRKTCRFERRSRHA